MFPPAPPSHPLPSTSPAEGYPRRARRALPAPKYWELRGGSAAPPAQKRAGRHGGGAAPAPATAPLRRPSRSPPRRPPQGRILRSAPQPPDPPASAHGSVSAGASQRPERFSPVPGGTAGAAPSPTAFRPRTWCHRRPDPCRRGPPRTPSVPAAGRRSSRGGDLGGSPPSTGSGERRAAPRRRALSREDAGGATAGVSPPPLPPSEDVALQVRLVGSHLQPHQHGPLAGEDPPARYGGTGAGVSVCPPHRQRSAPGGARTGSEVPGEGASHPPGSGARFFPFFTFFFFYFI